MYAFTSLDCSKDLDEIQRLAAKADEQKASFDPRVLPWVHGCDASGKTTLSVRHYVAKKPDDTIGGWLLAETKRRFGRTYVYLSEISTTRVIAEENRGLGKKLHELLVADARRDEANFIYLYPLTEKAAATYTAWGYLTPFELNYGHKDIKQQFLVLREATDKRPTIPEKLLAKLKEPVAATVFIEARQVAVAQKDEALAKLISDASRRYKDDPAYVARVRDVLETIAVFAEPGDPGEETLSGDEQLDMLREVFKPRGGRRRAQPKTKRAAKKTCARGYEVYNFRKTRKGVFYDCAPKRGSRKTRRSRK